MTSQQLRQVADKADMIVNGYAFTLLEDGRVRVLSLDRPERAAVLDAEGSVLETSMDDIELSIVQGCLNRNREFLDA